MWGFTCNNMARHNNKSDDRTGDGAQSRIAALSLSRVPYHPMSPQTADRPDYFYGEKLLMLLHNRQ